jgi:DNA topoisomerase IA
MSETKTKRDVLLTRASILQLLSDDEIGAVSTAEATVSLAKGDEYLDLEQLERGIQTAQGASEDMGGVLPKRAVHPDTWVKVQTHVAAFKGTRPTPVTKGR